MILFLLHSLFIVQRMYADNIVGYDLISDNNSTIGLASNHPGGLFSTSSLLTPPIYESDQAFSSGWDVGEQYWTISPFNTTGLISISVSAFMSSEDDGPRDFILQYKLSGGTWTGAGAITVSGTNANKNIVLPDECANVNNLSIRWITGSNTAVNGSATTNTGRSFINSISILGNQPIIPTTNSSNITFVSMTDSTITVDATPGNGDHRIVYIVSNTTGSVAPTFPVPTDDDTFIANSDYKTGNPTGYQVVYNGTGTKVTVKVPNPSNQYWVRYYDYILNVSMPRYTVKIDTNNPNLCALPTIVSNDAILIRLTTATIGGTILASPSSVTSRGTLFRITNSLGTSTTQGRLTENGGPFMGSFTRNLSSLTRGSRYYFKAFARNSSGTAFSNELYFENIPIFSGSGAWETPELWNVQQVPGSGTTFGSLLDKPVVNGNSTLNTSTACTALTINASNTLNISPGAFMNATTLNNNGGTAGLVIKASSSAANGSLKWINGTPQGTVEMYSKASWNLSDPSVNNRHKWQYFGIPVSTLTPSPTLDGSRVRLWDEAGTSIENHWNSLSNASTLVPFIGYEITQSTSKTYTFKGNLVNSNFSQTNLPYTSGALYPGQYIFANPYTAAINIASLAGKFGSNMEESVYLYNTGSFDDWYNTTNTGETIANTGTGAGQYTVATPATVGNLGVPTQIPSMQAFLIKSKSNSPANNSLVFNYNDVIAGNTEQQRVRSIENSSDKVALRIDVKGNRFSDKMWLFSDAECTRNYDSGWDGLKLFGSSRAPQIFAMEKDGYYQINAVSDLNNSNLGFQAGEDVDYIITITSQNLNKQYAGVFLVDVLEKTITNISVSGTEYHFKAVSTPKATNRFQIVTRNYEKDAPDNDSQLKIFSAQRNIFVENTSNGSGELMVYDIYGRMVKQFTFTANNITSLDKTLAPGAYLAKAIINGEEITKRLIVR